MLRLAVASLLILCGPALALAQQPPAATLAERTAGMTRADGFVPFYWDAARGRVLMEIPSFNEDVLYYVSAASGGGSVELSVRPRHHGHQRRPLPALGPARAGRRAEPPLPRRRTGTPRCRRTCGTRSPPRCWRRCRSRPTRAGACWWTPRRSSCATPATSIGELRRTNQGTFRFDAGRSAFYPPRMKAFPDNTEIETILTFAADAARPHRRQRDAGPAVVLDAHPSFVPAGAHRLHAARRRSAHRRQLGGVPRLRQAVQPEHRRRMGHPLAPREAEPRRRDERAEEADRLLPRRGHPGADPRRDEGRHAARGTRPSRRPASATRCR